MKQQLPVVTHPKNTSLHKKCVDVAGEQLGTKEFKELVRNMIHTMYKDDGIGIAAPQIGENIRLAIVGKEALKQSDDPHPFSKRKDLVIINPVYVPLSTDKKEEQEGCLSVLGKWGTVPRHTKIHVRLMTPDGKHHKFVASGFFARVLQHEIDHLDGVLFLDRASEVWDIEIKNEYPVV
jgi:peptide deformylase